MYVTPHALFMVIQIDRNNYSWTMTGSRLIGWAMWPSFTVSNLVVDLNTIINVMDSPACTPKVQLRIVNSMWKSWHNLTEIINIKWHKKVHHDWILEMGKMWTSIRRTASACSPAGFLPNQGRQSKSRLYSFNYVPVQSDIEVSLLSRNCLCSNKTAYLFL